MAFCSCCINMLHSCGTKSELSSRVDLKMHPIIRYESAGGSYWMDQHGGADLTNSIT